MIPLTWHLAAIQGMRRDQIVARIRIRTRRAWVASSRRFPLPVRRAASGLSGLPARPLGLHAADRPLVCQGLETVLARAAAVAAGRFRFLNEQRAWTLPIDWGAPDVSRLWRFHLHYFDDAPVLALAGAVTGEPAFARLFQDLAVDWIARNPRGIGDGWHPYPVSRRIPNWIYGLELAGVRDLPAGKAIAASVCQQARYLARNLEFDALGNHLLANLRALLFAASFFAGTEAERWWRTAARLLEVEVAEQFLADGGHFERSPMYHALVLQDLLECAALFRRRGGTPAWLSDTIDRAEAWLRGMCHPDCGIALFNDSTLEGPACAELAAFAGALRGSVPRQSDAGWRQRVWMGESRSELEARGSEGGPATPSSELRAPNPTLTALPQSGYFVLRGPEAGHALFLDAGDPSPSYIPAHAHADLLSYELSLFGRRVIVDSGVCEYAPGRWREYCRSTRAHNTIQVDGQEQSEIWGSFRLGRRAHPEDVRWRAIEGGVEVSAAHTGYHRLRGGVIHRRTVSYDGAVYRVSDVVTGTGRHRLESFLHFHPEMRIDLEAGGLVGEGQGVRLVIRFQGNVSAELRQNGKETSAPLQGWYCPEFGLRHSSPVAVLTWQGVLPAQIGYEIEPRRGRRPS
jgi:uncharacterized heparinase superfamily protein